MQPKTHAVLAPKELATTSLSSLNKAKPTQLCLSSSNRALALSFSSHPPSIPFLHRDDYALASGYGISVIPVHQAPNLGP